MQKGRSTPKRPKMCFKVVPAHTILVHLQSLAVVHCGSGTSCSIGHGSKMIKHPRSCAHHTDSALFGSIHKSMPRIWMKPCNVDVIFFRQHGGYLAHVVAGMCVSTIAHQTSTVRSTTTTSPGNGGRRGTQPINGSYGMKRISSIERFPNTISNQTKVGGR